MEISACLADITTLDVDAIVTAANNSLLGGGGVDGAIHRAAGPELLAAYRELQGCATGSAKITPGFRLPARWVIHCVGPVWTGGQAGEAALLASCYRHALLLAEQYQCRSIAFPGISTGVYGFPKDQAADIVLRTLGEYAQDHNSSLQIILCCFSREDLQRYQRRLSH